MKFTQPTVLVALVLITSSMALPATNRQVPADPNSKHRLESGQVMDSLKARSSSLGNDELFPRSTTDKTIEERGLLPSLISPTTLIKHAGMVGKGFSLLQKLRPKKAPVPIAPPPSKFSAASLLGSFTGRNRGTSTTGLETRSPKHTAENPEEDLHTRGIDEEAELFERFYDDDDLFERSDEGDLYERDVEDEA